MDTVEQRLDDPEQSAHYREWFLPLSPPAFSGGERGGDGRWLVGPECVPGRDEGPGLEAAVGGAPATEAMYHPRPKAEFVAGGYHRGPIWEHPERHPGFEAFLAEMDPEELAEIREHQRRGIDVVADLDPAYVASVRPAGGAALAQRRGREPDVRNSRRFLAEQPGVECDRTAECKCFICFAAGALLGGVRTGAMECLGLIADVRAGGRMPAVLSPATLEPSKPRFCLACLEVNENTRDRPVRLETLEATRDYVRGRGPCLVAVADECSGYNHHYVTVESSDFFGMVMFGYVWVFRALCFGWKLGSFYHQRAGMVLTGYYRRLGGRASQYLDDRTVVSRAGHEGDVADFRRWMYVLLLLLQAFGFWLSPKSDLVGSFQCITLGLAVDTVAQCFRAPRSKQEQFVTLVAGLLAGLERWRGADVGNGAGPCVSWLALARVTGKAIAFRWAIPLVRAYLNVPYAVLAGRRLRWGDRAGRGRARGPINLEYMEAFAASTRHEYRGDEIVIDPAAVGELASALTALSALVEEGRETPFTTERHTALLVVENDATLVQNGAWIELTDDARAAGVDRPWGTDEPLIFGNLLPRSVAGVTLAGHNSGLGEMGGMATTFLSLHHDPRLRRMVEGTRLDIGMDNQEWVSDFESLAVRGEGSLAKGRFLMLALHFGHVWGSEIRFYHVPGRLNRSDAPSRDSRYAGVRLKPEFFRSLWMSYGPFTMDYFGSEACGQRPPGADWVLPYYSLGPDPSCSGVNAFVQPLVAGRGYCNPPFRLCRAALELFRESRGEAVFVLPLLPEPRPVWWRMVERYECSRVVLPPPNSERRTSGGWADCDAGQSVPLVAVLLDFR